MEDRETMTRIVIRTGPRLGIRVLIALLLVALLAVPAMAHEGKVNFGIEAISITSANRITLGRVVVKGTVSCSKTTRGVEVGASVRQVASRTNTISAEGSGWIRCVAGTKVHFSVVVTPEYGKFVGGNALVEAYAYKSVWWENEETGEWHDHWDAASTAREMKLTR